MAQITYANKVTLNENKSIGDINKVTAGDMNEIKKVVNENYNEQQKLQNNLKWKYLGTISGTNTITLPKTFEELFIAVRRTGTTRTVYLAQTTVPYVFLQDDISEINIGGRLTLSNQGTGAIGQISKTSYQTSACYLSAAAIDDYETLIYYR